MKRPKDIAELASRLANAATAPLVAATPSPAPSSVGQVPEAVLPDVQVKPVASERKPRKAPKRTSIAVFLRVPGHLFDQYDEEAVRRTKVTGRGVTVQQVMLDLLEKAGPNV